jgi:RNA recognition motif-containing protein
LRVERGGPKTISLQPQVKKIKLEREQRRLKVRNIDEAKVSNEDLRKLFDKVGKLK